MESASVDKQDTESRTSLMASLSILLGLISEFGKYFISLAFGLFMCVFLMFNTADILFLMSVFAKRYLLSSPQESIRTLGS